MRIKPEKQKTQPLQAGWIRKNLFARPYPHAGIGLQHTSASMKGWRISVLGYAAAKVSVKLAAGLDRAQKYVRPGTQT
ncbi:MAG: hypothetical protein DMG71_05045 [Acidobacteria bacterium]|nr:MAG: hypothetical protein DMG71_05045 [Acidobacteriota bacterium]